MADEQVVLTPGVDIFTEEMLYERVAQSVGLEYEGGEMRSSDTFATYELDAILLSHLREKGIKPVQPASDTIFCLSDTNLPQDPQPGYCPSNVWSFKSGETPVISLSVTFCVIPYYRGVSLQPLTRGQASSPSDNLPNMRMFSALVETNIVLDLPQIARTIAQATEDVIIPWGKIGLGGLRRLTTIFDEFSWDNGFIRQLAQKDSTVFIPHPYLNDSFQWVVEENHFQILRAWSQQLKAYQSRFNCPHL